MSRGHSGHIVSSRLAWVQRYRVRSCLKNRTKQNITCRFLKGFIIAGDGIGFLHSFLLSFSPSFFSSLPLLFFLPIFVLFLRRSECASQVGLNTAILLP